MSIDKHNHGTTAMIDKCNGASTTLLEKIRDIANNIFSGERKFIIGVNGSLARREYTQGSDIDLFFYRLMLTLMMH